MPARTRAATYLGSSGHSNGRLANFSAEFIRKQVGGPVEVLHYHDASLRKVSLLRELGSAREAKAALRARRRLELGERRQHDADVQRRRAMRRAKMAVEREARRESVPAAPDRICLESPALHLLPSRPTQSLPLTSRRTLTTSVLGLRRRCSCRECGGGIALRASLSATQPPHHPSASAG